MGIMMKKSEPAPVRTERTRGRPRIRRWQAEFPYHWDADDQVSRRELLRFTVMASGALFVATAGIAALSYLNPLRTIRRQAIAKTTDIPPGGASYFHYPTSEDEAILLHLPNGRFVAFSGKCTHLSCAVYYDPAIGILLLGIQLWLLTTALDLYLAGQGTYMWLLALISGLVFVGGLLVLRMLARRPHVHTRHGG